MRIFTLIISFIFSTCCIAQDVNSSAEQASPPTYNIAWDAPVEKRISETDTVKFLSFIGAAYDFANDMLPTFYVKKNIPLQNATIEVRLTNEIYEPLCPLETLILNDNDLISNVINLNVRHTQSRFENYAHISFIPIRKNPLNGDYEKLVAFDLQETYDFTSVSKATTEKSYKTSSVLASGDIYKICVTHSGIHRLGYDDLAGMGINVGQINPQHIRIYGNGGGMLPESNSAFRYDDLVENAIYVHGESNGVFNTSDYVIFYAESPHSWLYNDVEKRFQHQIHHYSDVNCYFLTASHGAGKRISDEASLSAPATHTINSFHDYYLHEVDKVSLIHSGKEWFGEAFDIQTEQNFSFNVPNIKTGSPLRLKTSLVARAFQNSTFNVSVGGNNMNVLIASVPTSYTSSYARMSIDTMTFAATGSNINVNIKYNKPSNNAMGWLNYIQLNVERNLIFSGSQMTFRNISSIGTGHISEYVLGNATTSTRIWEITNPLEVKSISTTLSGNQLNFTLSSDSLRTFVAHNGSSYLKPTFHGKVPNQNLHGLGQFDMLIVTHPLFINEAQRLALEHYNVQDLSVVVVTTEQVYNEFSSGVRDAAAIRDFAKMFYDRANNPAEQPKYLLLFGDGSYDNKNRIPNNTNFIPTYQSANSLEPTASYVTDDFFGLFDAGEGQNADGSLNIGIGRFPVQTIEEARNAVNKTIIYLSKKNLLTDTQGCAGSSGRIPNYGDWRNIICFIADDEDGNLHISQAESLANMVDTANRNYNIDKIYLDAYLQVTNAGGQRYPEVNDAINNRVQKGALIVNYTGHGGELGWAHERVLEVSDINAWTNKYNMPVFVTATCEFSRFDDPNRTSAGEYVFLNPNGGGIALLSTTRLAFANTNFALNKNFYSYLFNKVNDQYYSLGDLIKLSKNAMGNISSVRNFVLLGDPAIKPAHPEFNVTTTIFPDTMKALSKITIEGYIADHNGSVLDDFNGTIYPTVFDKPSFVTTLANDPGSQPFTFKLQKNILFKGKAAVENGYFSFEFIVPKDIAYQYAAGKISYYAEDGVRDANGHFEGFIIGGFNENYTSDDTGPKIELYMNDESFVFGGITDKNPILLALLSDESGINTTGNGIGHDITAIMNDNSNRVIVLNDFYESDLNSYQSGKVVYPFYNLDEGLHNIRFKVWDVHNNSSEAYIEFYVTDAEEMAIKHLMNYPNPFNDRTFFIFEHNQTCHALEVKIEIISLTGVTVKTIKKTIYSNGFKTEPIEWDGAGDNGSRVGKGAYIYRLTVKTDEGHYAEKTEKLVIIK